MAILPLKKETTIVEPVTGEKPVVKVIPPQETFDKERKIVRRRQVIWYVWLVIEVILFLRFFLRLFGANQNNLFNFILNIISTPLVFPFNNLFTTTRVGLSSIVVEWSTLFAIIFYSVLAYLLAFFFRLKKPIDPEEAEKKAKQDIPYIEPLN